MASPLLLAGVFPKEKLAGRFKKNVTSVTLGTKGIRSLDSLTKK
jgi:hypothetical protein